MQVILIEIFLRKDNTKMTLYYLDSNAPNGGNGSIESPFNSLNEISNLNLSGGDRILLKRNSVFYETLEVNDSGTEGNPIIVESYGIGQKPIISAGKLITKDSDSDNIDWVIPDLADAVNQTDIDSINNNEHRYVIHSSPTSQPVLIKTETTNNDQEYELVEYAGYGQKGNLSEGTYTLSREIIDYGPYIGNYSWVVYYKPKENENPGDFIFEVSQRSSAINITGDYVEVNDVYGRLGNGEAVLSSSGNNTVFNDTEAYFGKAFGIVLKGANSEINDSIAQYNYSTGLAILTPEAVNSTIQNSTSSFNGNLKLGDRKDRGGIGVQADNSFIYNNTIYSNGDISAKYFDDGPGDDAIALYDNNNALVANNYIFNSAGTAISMSYGTNSYGHTIVNNVIGNWNLYGVGDDDKPSPYNSDTIRGTYGIGIFANPTQSNEGDMIVDNNTVYSNQADTTLIGIQAAMSYNNDWMGDTSVQNNDVYIPNNNNPNTIGLRIVRDTKVGFQKVIIDENNVLVGPNLPDGTGGTLPRNYYSWRTGGNVETASELSVPFTFPNNGPTSIYEANGTNNSSSEFIFGSDDADSLTGTSNREYLIGFDGNDSFNGLAGDDVFLGGEGNDLFIFSNSSDDDIITDFQVGEDSFILQDGITIIGITEVAYNSSYIQRTDTIVTFSSNNTVTLYDVTGITNSSQLL
jgi:hypothetical protein